MKALLRVTLAFGCFATAQCQTVTVDFGSRSGSQPVIQPNMIGVEYLGSLPDAASRQRVVSAGIYTSRVHAGVPYIFATSTPNWKQIDVDMEKFQALGVHPIVEIDQVPPYLYPSPVVCRSAPETSVPSSFTGWGQMAAEIVHHLDLTWPGVVQDIEVWNEPDTQSFCSPNHLADYLSLYAAAAPLIKAQARADGASIRVGGPGTSNAQYGQLLTDSRTAPYVDWYSFHSYPAGPGDAYAGMQWNGGPVQPLSARVASYVVPQYALATSFVRAGSTHLGSKTPIYFDEYNDNYGFVADCCRNDPTYSPLYNSMVFAEILNLTYTSPGTYPPAKFVYYASAQQPFCIMGAPGYACAPAKSNAGLIPYPQLYTFELISSPIYLDLVDGGHMASTVTTSNAQGLVVTAWYTAKQDSVLFINPTNEPLPFTLQMNNTGLASPVAGVFSMPNGNGSIVGLSYLTFSSTQPITGTISALSVAAVALRE
jgi:hypothetical protein